MQLLLIDLSGIYWEKWHAAAGADANAAHDWTIACVRELAEGAERVIVCLDSGRSFRVDVYPEYKANRPPKPEAAVAQLRRVIARLRADGYATAEAPGYEADDIMATIAAVAVIRGLETRIASADKDMLQLVCESGRVSVASTKTGAVYATGHDVMAKLGVEPRQVADLLALAGDSADNVPGVPGIGLKTAAAILAAHGGLDGLMIALADGEESGEPPKGCTPRIAGLLREHWESVKISRRLTGLAANAPVDVDGLIAAEKPQERTEKMIETAEESALEAQGPRDEDPRDVPPAEPSAPGIEPTAGTTALVRHVEQTPTVAQGKTQAWEISDGPRRSDQAWQLAKVLANSGMFKTFRTPESAFVAILAGNDLGLSPMAALRGIHVVEGKPTLSADMMASIILASKKARYFRCVESSVELAVYETHREGDPEKIRHTFTMADAKAAELAGKSMWKKYPRNMLRARCASELARMVYPDLLAGVYTAEELEA